MRPPSNDKEEIVLPERQEDALDGPFKSDLLSKHEDGPTKEPGEGDGRLRQQVPGLTSWENTNVSAAFSRIDSGLPTLETLGADEIADSNRQLPVHGATTGNPPPKPMQQFTVEPDLNNKGAGSSTRKLSRGCIVAQVMLVGIFLFLGALVVIQQVEPAALSEAEEVNCAVSCGSPEIDESIRELLAEKAVFDPYNQFGDAISFVDIDIPCLPPNAFSLLSKQDLENVKTINFDSNGLTKITKGAFNDVDFLSLETFIVTNNGLSSLEDSFFEQFFVSPNFRGIILSQNAFTTIKNPVFGFIDRRYEFIVIDGNTGLVEIPPALAEVNTVQISLQNNPSLFSTENENAEPLFSRVSVESLLITGSPLADRFANTLTALDELLGLDAGTVQ